MPRPLRVVIAHDYLTQRGGAERVVIDLLRVFPKARIVTSVYEASTTYPVLADFDITALWPNRLSFFRSDPRRAFPLLATAFSSHKIEDADLVICSSSGWSHGVRSRAPKLAYCYSPPRWLHEPQDYFIDYRPSVRRSFRSLSGPLRTWDAKAAASVAQYVAISTVVQKRIRRAYGIDAPIIAPPRGIEPQGDLAEDRYLLPGFFLTVGRARGYKNTEAICKAAASLPDVRLVVVGGLPAGDWPDRIQGRQDVTDAELRWLYMKCVGLIAVAHEDFGLTPVEAQAFGRPSVVLRAGGYLDSTVDGVTGVFIDAPDPDDIRAGMLRVLDRPWDERAICASGERFGPLNFESLIRDIADRTAFTTG